MTQFQSTPIPKVSPISNHPYNPQNTPATNPSTSTQPPSPTLTKSLTDCSLSTTPSPSRSWTHSKNNWTPSSSTKSSPFSNNKLKTSNSTKFKNSFNLNNNNSPSKSHWKISKTSTTINSTKSKPISTTSKNLNSPISHDLPLHISLIPIHTLDIYYSDL
jgi:hypothetical protein